MQNLIGCCLGQCKENSYQIMGSLEIIILSKAHQTEKDKHHMISLIRGIQNMTQMNLSIKQKQTRRHRELMLTKGERGGGKGVRR